MNQKQEREIQPIDECDTDLCRTIWVATILQAVIDARSNSKKRDLQKAKAEALEWLQAKEGDQSDFAAVCDLAGLDYQIAQPRLLEIVSNPDEIADFRCIRKALHENKGMELRSKYFKRMRRQEEKRLVEKKRRQEEKRQIQRAKNLATQAQTQIQDQSPQDLPQAA